MSESAENLTGKEIVVLHETVVQSIVKDIVGFAVSAGLFWLGVYMQSSAAQWMAFFLIAMAAFKFAFRSAMGAITTPQKAADMLRDKYGVTAATEREQPP